MLSSMTCLITLVGGICVLGAYIFYRLAIAPSFDPLHSLPGPPVKGYFGNHLNLVLNAEISPRAYELLTRKYGRTMRIRGFGPWDERLLTLDPVAVAHILKNTAVYEKPLLSRRIINNLIGCGMLSAEGQLYKRLRRIATPAFSAYNMRALVPHVFKKAQQLTNRWLSIMKEHEHEREYLSINVCHWLSRATFDVIGLAGLDYNFDAIQDETNPLFTAYRDMFEKGLSQTGSLRTLVVGYLPFLNVIFRNKTVRRCQMVIRDITGQLIRDRKRQLEEAATLEIPYSGRDLLSLLIRANTIQDVPPESHVSDGELLDSINTFIFAGSDTSSLAMTWTLLLLARHPAMQTRLRTELLSLGLSRHVDEMTEEEMQRIFTSLAEFSFFHNIVRESLRLIPPVHSSMRVATRTDIIPLKYAIRSKDGEATSIEVPKGTFIHIPVEGFNLDKDVWGDDSWDFNPDRWDNLPQRAKELPGLFSNILTFSAGPRSCIGFRFALIGVKTMLYFLIVNFVFEEAESKVVKHNTVLMRPYISGRFHDGSQCPLKVSVYRPP
ncbi:cytochrome-450 hydroxylase [Desarmillaria ectypa]|nr:cytochrome-450 hydroxylase [Desarmillaria ectypa]